MGLKNLVITPVVIGRISIGERTESNGKQLPKKSDEFHITSNQQVNGQWVPPKGIDEAKAADGKLRSIPVRVMFDTPENNFRAGYACFNNDGRQVCAGDGEKACRMTPRGREDVECPGHEQCQFGQANRCKPYARLMVAMESNFEKDPLAAFAFRTTGYNSVNALTSRLAQFAALTGNRMSGMSCNLVLRAKSTAKSRRQAIYYVDIEPRGSLFEAIGSAQTWHEECAKRGINLEALDAAVAAGFAATPYIDSGETMEAEDVTTEFYGEGESEGTAEGSSESVGQAPESNEPSPEFLQIMNRISGMTDPKSENAAVVWIKGRPISDSEKAIAIALLTERIAALKPASNESQNELAA